MKATLLLVFSLCSLLTLGAQEARRPLGLALFIAQAHGGEKDFYGTGGALEFTLAFRPGRRLEGRLRAEVFALGAGSWKGRFGIPAQAHSEGLAVGWDFVYMPQNRAVLPFLGVGASLFRYTYRHVPDNLTMIDPSNPPLRTDGETTGAFSASAGFILPLGPALEGELRYTLLKHPGTVLFAAVGNGLLGNAFDPSPSHLALGVRWRF